MAINRTSPKKGKVVDIPTAPTIGTATAGGESATVAFTAATRGGPVTTYTALSNPGSITGTGSSSPITVSGLTAGTSYTFTVRGANATGNGEYSVASNSVVPTVSTAYESIATVAVGAGGSSSITFSSIPNTYKHLQIRLLGRISRSGEANDFFTVRFNSDTNSNYSWHALEGSGSTVYAEAGASTDLPRNGDITATTAGANMFGAGVVDILEYANTNIYKTTRSFTGRDQNGSGWVWFGSSNWRSTSAISTITITPTYGTGFVQYSHFALYGIRG